MCLGLPSIGFPSLCARSIYGFCISKYWTSKVATFLSGFSPLSSARPTIRRLRKTGYIKWIIQNSIQIKLLIKMRGIQKEKHSFKRSTKMSLTYCCHHCLPYIPWWDCTWQAKVLPRFIECSTGLVHSFSLGWRERMVPACSPLNVNRRERDVSLRRTSWNISTEPLEWSLVPCHRHRLSREHPPAEK